MEALVSAVLGDLISRSISFAVDRCCHRRREATVEDNLQRLRRVLLRIRVTVEEADRRRVTNRAMLQQLQHMREGLYRGYYVLSDVKRQVFAVDQDKARDREVSRHVHSSSFALSQFNPAKRVCTLTASDTGHAAEAGLQGMLTSLERKASDMKELVVFLTCYPPLLREPYSRHLWLENCMFGREAEKERIIDFLLKPEPAGAQDLAVLPVIGRARVGKSTLVEHVCYDERVRNRFSMIVFFGESNILDDENLNLIPLGDNSGVIKHRNNLTSTRRSLVVIELVGDVDESTRGRTMSTLKGERAAPVSKVVVTSRSEKIAGFGTRKALLELEPLPREAYWYFFKTIAFGSTGGAEEPPEELAHACMEMADLMNRSFIVANITASVLRGNLRPQFWQKVLKRMKDHMSMHLVLFGEHPIDRLAKDRPIYLWRLPKSDSVLRAYSCYQECSAQQHDLPKILWKDVQTGSATPRGKFEALAWRSRIPPYYSYVMNCGVETPSSPLHIPPRNKQIRKRQARLNSM